MYLDYVDSTQSYVLHIDRSEETDIDRIVRDHGFDFSTSASTGNTAVLFTKEPYAAVSFYKDASPEALVRLAPLAHRIDLSMAETSGGHVVCPADKEPWAFQIPGVEFILSHKNTLVGDQPGLGKTAQAVMAANEMGAKRVLVICPANIRLQWAKMIREWSTMEGRYSIYLILKSSDGVHPQANWTIISYDLARNPDIHYALGEGYYDLLIIDEAHFAKTVDAKRTQAIFGGGEYTSLTSRAELIVALTGTPLPNRPRECYTLARGLCFESIDSLSEDAFRHRFNPSMLMERFDPKTMRTSQWVKEKSGRLPELRNRLRGNFMVRRLKRNVMKYLPPVSYNIHYVEETGLIRKALHAEHMLDIDPTDLSGVSGDELGHIATVRRMMGTALAPQVCDYVEMLLSGGVDKILLLGWHHDVLDIYEERLTKYGFCRVDGRTSPVLKQHYVDQFQSDFDLRVFGGNLMSIGVGTDGLQTVCDYLVVGEADWVPAVNFDQGVGRLDRGGQKSAVTADFLVAPRSFLERILQNAIAKLRDIHSSLDQEF